MQSSHPAHLFQSSSDVAAGQRRAIKAKALRKAGRPIFLGKRQDDTEELAVAGAGSDGGKAKCLDSLVDGLGASDGGVFWWAGVIGFDQSVGKRSSGGSAKKSADQRTRGVYRLTAIL